MQEELAVNEDIAIAMEGRRDAYRFFSSALLHEFTVEQIRQMRQIAPDQGSQSQVEEYFSRIRRYLAHPGPDPRTALAVDYARVFLSAGIYEGRTAEPYESAFTGPEYLLMQEARDQVVTIYRENGVDVDAELHMPEDHLGLELEFMSLMADKTARELRAGDGEAATVRNLAIVQRDFCNDHILNWIDNLTEKVDEFAKLPLYPALMRIIKGYVQDDVALMDKLAQAASDC